MNKKENLQDATIWAILGKLDEYIKNHPKNVTTNNIEPKNGISKEKGQEALIQELIRNQKE